MTRLTPCLRWLDYNLNELFSSRFRSSSSPLACGSWVVPSTPSSMAPWIAHSEQSTRKYLLLLVALWSRPLAVCTLTTKKCQTALTSPHKSRRKQKSHNKRRNCASFPLLTHNQKGIQLLITWVLLNSYVFQEVIIMVIIIFFRLEMPILVLGVKVLFQFKICSSQPARPTDSFWKV